uniref:VWFA domain-containing protein n=1 Tax=Apteryx owenii TaxID=8824 RepID=A0A8B9PIS3_APTOW
MGQNGAKRGEMGQNSAKEPEPQIPLEPEPELEAANRLQLPPGATNNPVLISLTRSHPRGGACGPTAQRACGENMEVRGYCFRLATRERLPAALPGTALWGPYGVPMGRGRPGMGDRGALWGSTWNTTWTASGIRRVVRELFGPGQGARDGAHRVLIVVTDGQIYGDTLTYGDVIPEADRAGIIRYAIGVGSAFSQWNAQKELRDIASKPSKEHIFRVDNFNALQGIQNELKDKIFAIEGTQSSQSSSFQLEMAQEGFSALLTPEGPVLGAVGAYGWSGGVFLYGEAAEPTFVNVSQAARDMNDSYLGYAAESLTLGGARAFVLGAPRYRHVGKVVVVLRGPRGTWEPRADVLGQQVGSYFGAALCALDLAGAGSTDTVLVGAPMYYGAGSGGRVSVCTLARQGDELRCQRTLQGEPGHPFGRFGASLGRLGDVNGDGRDDVAVGAPLEDEERGAVYVFLGERGGLGPQYSQRIAGARFSSGPRHFGQAVSGGTDLTGDRLPDVAVGARGQVLLLRWGRAGGGAAVVVVAVVVGWTPPVTNLRQRRVPVTVTFLVPAVLSSAPVWENPRVVPSQVGAPRNPAVGQEGEGGGAPPGHRTPWPPPTSALCPPPQPELVQCRSTDPPGTVPSTPRLRERPVLVSPPPRGRARGGGSGRTPGRHPASPVPTRTAPWPPAGRSTARSRRWSPPGPWGSTSPGAWPSPGWPR